MQHIELLFDRVRDTAWDIFVNIVKEDEFPMSPKLNFRNCVICFLYQEKISTWKCNENYVTRHLLKKTAYGFVCSTTQKNNLLLSYMYEIRYIYIKVDFR